MPEPEGQGLAHGETPEPPEQGGAQQEAVRGEVLKRALEARGRHERVAKRDAQLFVVFQSVTIVAAALATVLAIAEWLPPEVRAIPAAIATLAAAVLAAFPFRHGGRRHEEAWRRLDYEIFKFRERLLEYAEPPALPPRQGSIDYFVDRVEAIDRAGGEEEPEEKVLSGDEGRAATQERVGREGA